DIFANILLEGVFFLVHIVLGSLVDPLEIERTNYVRVNGHLYGATIVVERRKLCIAWDQACFRENLLRHDFNQPPGRMNYRMEQSFGPIMTNDEFPDLVSKAPIVAKKPGLFIFRTAHDVGNAGIIEITVPAISFFAVGRFVS